MPTTNHEKVCYETQATSPHARTFDRLSRREWLQIRGSILRVLREVTAAEHLPGATVMRLRVLFERMPSSFLRGHWAAITNDDLVERFGGAAKETVRRAVRLAERLGLLSRRYVLRGEIAWDGRPSTSPHLEYAPGPLLAFKGLIQRVEGSNPATRYKTECRQAPPALAGEGGACCSPLDFRTTLEVSAGPRPQERARPPLPERPPLRKVQPATEQLARLEGLARIPRGQLLPEQKRAFCELYAALPPTVAHRLSSAAQRRFDELDREHRVRQLSRQRDRQRQTLAAAINAAPWAGAA